MKKKWSLSQAMFYSKFLYGVAMFFSAICSFFQKNLFIQIVGILLFVIAGAGVLMDFRKEKDNYDELAERNLQIAYSDTHYVLILITFVIYILDMILDTWDIKIYLSLGQIAQFLIGIIYMVTSLKFIQLEKEG